MKEWIKSGIKSLYVTIPIMFFISIAYGFARYTFEGSFIIEPLKTFFIFTIVLTLIVLLISYFTHRNK